MNIFEGIRENLRNLSELNDEAIFFFSFFFGKESRGEVSFHEYLIEIRDLERKRKRRNKVE